MKRISLALSAIFIAGLFVTSCSSEKNFVVEKRHYGKGYYVHSNGNRDMKKTAENNSVAVVNEKNTAASNSNAVVPANSIIENTVTENKQNTPFVAAHKSQQPKHTAVKKQNVIARENTSGEKAASVSSQASRSTLKQNAPKQSGGGGDVNTVLLVILCLFIPPLAVFLADGIGLSFWVDLILTLLFFLPGVIYAFIVCFA